MFPKTYSLGDSPTADGVIRAMLDQFKTEYKSLDFASCEAKIKERYGVGDVRLPHRQLGLYR